VTNEKPPLAEEVKRLLAPFGPAEDILVSFGPADDLLAPFGLPGPTSAKTAPRDPAYAGLPAEAEQVAALQHQAAARGEPWTPGEAAQLKLLTAGWTAADWQLVEDWWHGDDPPGPFRRL
jgi:hypothetical protein